VDPLPFDGPITKAIDAADLADTPNVDDERRLMYVALTRAERYLFVTSSKPSKFLTVRRNERRPVLAEIMAGSGGQVVSGDAASVPRALEYEPSHASREQRLVTSFSDLRYFLECPHDFYLRKVLGFAPTIDQAFGYGRGVHNLLREVHTDPKSWAKIAGDRAAVEERLRGLVGRGLFYLRHTVGEPEENMRRNAVRIVADYVQFYKDELAMLTFEPERAFETLIPEEQVLVSGAIDVLRLDDPPRVTIIDFKSGEAGSDARMSLDEEEMALQVSVYGLAARRELEYQPDLGLVRYLAADDETRQLEVRLDDDALAGARKTVAKTARDIRDRQFWSGPRRPPRRLDVSRGATRCHECDFLGICGRQEATSARND
jgi:DNA helicase-2/ATP-dependent DNA helicase PcrA